MDMLLQLHLMLDDVGFKLSQPSSQPAVAQVSRGFWPSFVAGRRANHTWQKTRMWQRMRSLRMGPWL